ncbi:LysR family transcriptional regulator [Gordonia sputi]
MSVDLNLARPFVTVYETRSVTVAADVLGVTQPTVSYSLAKLRRLLGDPLFVRGPGGLLPTAEAERLYRSVANSVSSLDAAFVPRAPFDPESAPALTLSLSDLGEVTVLPLIVAELAERTSRFDLRVRAFDLDTAADELIRGVTDVVIASPQLDAPRLERTVLFSEGYVGMVAADHPRLGRQTPTHEDLVGERLVVVDGSTGHDEPRRAIRELGLDERIALRVTSFATLGYVVQSSELVAIVPDLVAELMARATPVTTFGLPWSLGRVEVAAYTRRSPAASPAQRWFFDAVTASIERIPTSAPTLRRHVGAEPSGLGE